MIYNKKIYILFMRLRLSEEVGKMKVKNRGFPDLKKIIRSPSQGLFDKSDLFLLGEIF
jgi:hypothetical protein